MNSVTICHIMLLMVAIMVSSSTAFAREDIRGVTLRTEEGAKGNRGEVSGLP